MRLRSLKTKFILYIIPLILLVSLSFLAFFLYRSNSLVRNELIDFGLHLIRDLSLGSELAVTSEDPVLLQPSFEATFKEKDVLLVAVYNREGKIVASKKKIEIGEEISGDIMEELAKEKSALERSGYTKEKEEIYNFYGPVLASEILAPVLAPEERELVGFVRVAISLEKVRTQSREILILGLSITTLVVFLGIFLLIFLAGNLIRPLDLLRKGTETVAKGDLDYRIKIKTGDETEQLAQGFNQMTESLKKSREELEKAKIDLEQRVDELESFHKEVAKKTKDLKETREVLLNISEDAETASTLAIEEKNKTLAIINNLTDGLMVFDKSNNISFVNPRSEEMFWIKKEEIEGKNIEELKKYILLSPIIDVIFSKGKIKKVERAEFSPGGNVTIEVTTIPLKELEGTEAIVIFHDISREKVVEKLKSEFVSISAHQLRTPLSAIKWSLSLLKEGKMKEEDKEDLLNKVYQSNERMIGLINDLLDVTRIEEGRYLYNLKREDVKSVVRESIKSAQEEAKRKNIQFKLSLPKGKIPQVKVDEEKLGLAIQNLAENAVHYTKPGGKAIISVEYHKDKKEIFLKFKDTGVGIPKHQQKRVFSRFFRGENVMRMETEGSGLGLFITKNVIEAHKGKIWFESKEGKGSTFYFTLPVFSKG